MSRRLKILAATVVAILMQTGCIRPQNYHPGQSTYYYKYSKNDKNYGHGYFENATVHEAYVEFDAQGKAYTGRDGKSPQLDAALNLIERIKFPDGKQQPPRQIALYVFVHGWKNNAGEDSGNVWGFRRFLSVIAHQHRGVPVVGVYIGWPGASLKNDKFLSFWNREPVADQVGTGDLVPAMTRILQAAKGENYNDGSVAVVIGHSFGGIVLERVATKLVGDQLKGSQLDAPPPADLFVLINEAGAAWLTARDFLLELASKGVKYTDREGKDYPLILSMTSTGDVATKLAYPGAESLSPNRTAAVKYTPADLFGQETSTPYQLLTPANMIALQSHQIIPSTTGGVCELAIPLTAKLTYCMNPITQNPPPTGSTRVQNAPVRLNQTPYWIMQLPQIFVPDHSSVFQDYFLNLITSVACRSNLAECPTTTAGTRPPGPPPMMASPGAGRPTMRRKK